MTADRDSLNLPPVAVFLDGWQYHKGCIQEDLMKRQGLTLSGKYLCWSLTWHDIQHAFVGNAGNESKVPNPLKENTGNSPAGVISQIASAHGLTDQAKLAELPPLLQLLKFLSNPNPELWRKFAGLRMLCWLDQQTMQSPDTMTRVMEVLKPCPSQFMDCVNELDLKLSGIAQFGCADIPLTLSIALESSMISSLDSSRLVTAVMFDTSHLARKETHLYWQKLLQILNLNQFIKYSFATTADGLESGSYSQLMWDQENTAISPSDWDDIVQLADEEVQAVLQYLSDHSAVKPEVAYEYTNGKGKVTAEAELAWPHLKIALLLDYQVDENQQEFDKMGWTVITQETAMDVILQLVGAQ